MSLVEAPHTWGPCVPEEGWHCWGGGAGHSNIWAGKRKPEHLLTHHPMLRFCSLLPKGQLDLKAACNALYCCQPRYYSPLCGSDGTMYYSPCYAGCPEGAVTGPGGQKVSVATPTSPALAGTRGNVCLCVISTVVGLPRYTEAVAVSLRRLPLAGAMLPQGSALPLVRASPSFWFSCSL